MCILSPSYTNFMTLKKLLFSSLICKIKKKKSIYFIVVYLFLSEQLTTFSYFSSYIVCLHQVCVHSVEVDILRIEGNLLLGLRVNLPSFFNRDRLRGS